MKLEVQNRKDVVDRLQPIREVKMDKNVTGKYAAEVDVKTEDPERVFTKIPIEGKISITNLNLEDDEALKNYQEFNRAVNNSVDLDLEPIDYYEVLMDSKKAKEAIEDQGYSVSFRFESMGIGDAATEAMEKLVENISGYRLLVEDIYRPNSTDNAVFAMYDLEENFFRPERISEIDDSELNQRIDMILEDVENGLEEKNLTY